VTVDCLEGKLKRLEQGGQQVRGLSQGGDAPASLGTSGQADEQRKVEQFLVEPGAVLAD
jgi:hypothetical protein